MHAPVPGSARKRSARPRPETLTGIGAVLSLVLATSVYAVGQSVLPSSAASTAAGLSTARVMTAPSAVPAQGTMANAADSADAAAAAVPAGAAAVPPAAAAVPPSSIGPGLEALLNGIIEANDGYRVGVALVDVADGTGHEYGAREKFTAASTGKVLAAAAYYRLAETGQLALDTPMGVSSAGDQISQMIQQSNNDSWALILAAIGSERLRDYAASIGVEYDLSDNALTPAEMARTLWLLYSGQLLDANDTAQLLSFMQDTNLETLIPAALPPDIVVFHKYGMLDGNLHDASILVRGGKAYAFVVYTLGGDDSDAADRTAIIHELTAAVTAALF